MSAIPTDIANRTPPAGDDLIDPRPVSGRRDAPWTGFTIGDGSEQQTIRLEQVDTSTFRLGSSIRYDGPTGLEGLQPEEDDAIRRVDAETLLSTDLASVPRPCRWWLNTYGIHTPAALIHDRFIGATIGDEARRPAGVSDAAIDRYFRFMLHELGVPFFCRWLMWAAVAMRTRFHGGARRTVALVIWAIAATAGVSLLVVGLATSTRWCVVVALLAPLPASLLWGRQAAAGLIIAYVGVPFVLPPSALAVPFLATYAALERVGVWCSQLVARRHCRVVDVDGLEVRRVSA